MKMRVNVVLDYEVSPESAEEEFHTTDPAILAAELTREAQQRLKVLENDERVTVVGCVVTPV